MIFNILAVQEHLTTANWLQRYGRFCGMIHSPVWCGVVSTVSVIISRDSWRSCHCMAAVQSVQQRPDGRSAWIIYAYANYWVTQPYFYSCVWRLFVCIVAVLQQWVVSAIDYAHFRGQSHRRNTAFPLHFAMCPHLPINFCLILRVRYNRRWVIWILYDEKISASGHRKYRRFAFVFVGT